jgi:ligand-binding sensor domain-containing protein/signal transduction histidine kinase
MVHPYKIKNDLILLDQEDQETNPLLNFGKDFVAVKSSISNALRVVLIFLLSGTVVALEPRQHVRQYVQDVWQTDAGLPQNYVVGIVQSRDGYIWLATQEGLARFDGIKFNVFDKRNTSQIKDNNIQALFEDREGNLWFGTEGGGVNRFSGGRFFNYTTSDGLAGNIIDAIYQDAEGAIWIGTVNGLSRFKDDTFLNFTTRDGLASDVVLAICEDGNGDLWVGTENGLNRLTNGHFSTYTTRQGLANNLIRSIYRDHSGGLWVGTRDGLNKLENDRFITYSTKQNLANNSILSICEDGNGNLWIGTDGGGLSRLRDGIFTTYSKDDGLSDNSVASIYEDREGNLWIGTYGGGLNRLKSGRFETYTAQYDLSDDMARAIFEDAEGTIWIATRNGLNRLKDGKFTVYKVSQGLAGDSVLSLHGDTKGNLWIGTRSGLSQFRNGKFTNYTTKQGLSDDTILSITDSDDNGLWVGTSQGLNLLQNGRFSSFGIKEGLTNDGVWSLWKDRKGALWIGTDGGGLNRFENGKFQAYTTKNGLANDVVLSIYGDQQGALWIGTSGGLSRLKNDRFTTYTINDGLYDDVVFQILEDDIGYLWMSCNKGVFRVLKAELDDFAEGRIKSIASMSFGTSDGMKSRECNGGFQPAGWKSRDGRLWFPTVKGVAVVAPDRIRENEYLAPVVIEQVLVDYVLVAPGQQNTFAAGKDRFEFHFTGLSYVASEKVQFKYKLEGFDADWINAGTKRDASYTNIPPGHYTFRVIASNNDLVWNPNGASFQFYLKPHFYQTYWFYALCAVFAALIGWTLYRLRVRQIQSEFSAVLAERTRLARDIHDTLTQGFVGISLQLEAVSTKLQGSSAGVQQHLALAQKMVESCLTEARRSVWDLRRRATDTGDLASSLSDVVQTMTSGTSVTGEVKISGKPDRLPELVESNLLRIAQEAVTNALKHSNASKILVEVAFEDSLVRLRIVDDGDGFDVNVPLSSTISHFGLVGMRERADQIGFELVINTAPGHGTEITAKPQSSPRARQAESLA